MDFSLWVRMSFYNNEKKWENQKFLFSELNQDLVLELYLLLNVEDKDKEIEGTIWFHQLSDPGNATNKDLNYLPIRKMVKIGKIYEIIN